MTRLIEHMLDRGGVWFAPLEEIAAHVRHGIDDGTYRPRVDYLPYYRERVAVTR